MAQDYEGRWHNSTPSAILKVFPGPLVLSHAHSGSLQFCPHRQLPWKQSSSVVENADPYSALLSSLVGQLICLHGEGRCQPPWAPGLIFTGKILDDLSYRSSEQ